MTIAKLPNGQSVSENVTVAQARATLSQLPSYGPLSIPGLTLVVSPTPGPGQFSVEYTQGVLSFNAAQEGITYAVTFTAAQEQLTNSAIADKVNETIDEVNALAGEDPESLLQQKGDLITRDATAPTRLPVGTDGQMLVADSTEPKGLKWVDAPVVPTLPLAIADGGTGQATQTAAMDALSPTTTKGDILVDDGTSVVRRAVGTDGQVLTADSGEADGVKWATPAAGGMTAEVVTGLQVIVASAAATKTLTPASPAKVVTEAYAIGLLGFVIKFDIIEAADSAAFEAAGYNHAYIDGANVKLRFIAGATDDTYTCTIRVAY